MSPELWTEISPLLDEALELDPAQRAAWLSTLEHERPWATEPLRRLLAAHEHAPAHDPLDGPPTALLASALTDPQVGPLLEPGLTLGPYRLLAPLGEGGMAEVWLAEQTEHVLRKVALKIPRHGLEEGSAAAARFRRERDILAALEHPHIARLYDAGFSAAGVPYLAMEWVAGSPITQYCDAQHLTIAQRLALFRQVLAAVGHAHANLVIHRDLKPSNIFVTPQGQVRLLDFGIARLLEDADASARPRPALPGASSAGHTLAHRAFTPEVAAPEQLAGGPLTTAADVYALGIVLYELLCGRRPYRLDREALSLHDALLQQTVLRPSQTEVTAATAAARGTAPSALSRALRGNLDAIVARAMARDPSARYSSVEAFDRDLQRHLEHRPAQAHPRHWRHAVACFLRRNRWPLLGGTAAGLALCAGLAAALWQAERAEAQAQRAITVQRFMAQLFAANDPDQARGMDISARELLDRGVQRLEKELAAQPEVLADLQGQVGRILFAMGAEAQARPQLESSVDGYRRLGIDDSEAALDVRLDLAALLVHDAHYAAARQLSEENEQLATRRFGALASRTLHAQATLAYTRVALGGDDAAAERLQRALDARRTAGAPAGPETVYALDKLGESWLTLLRPEKARPAFEDCIAQAVGQRDVALVRQLICRIGLQSARSQLGERAALLEDMPALVATVERHLGPTALWTIAARGLHARTLEEEGRYDEAVAQQQINVRHAAERSTTDNGDRLAYEKFWLARILASAGRHEEAIPFMRQSLAYSDSKQEDAPNWDAVAYRRELGNVLRKAGRVAESLQMLEEARTKAQALPGHATSRSYGLVLQGLALTQHGLGRDDEAAATMAHAARVICNVPGPLLRTKVLDAWLQALLRPGDATSRAAFTAAAKAYADTRPMGHAAHADLARMQAELDQRAAPSSVRRVRVTDLH